MKDIKVLGVDDSDGKEETIKDPHIQLSFYDLNQIIGFKSAKANNNIDELERILYQCGLNTKEKYIIRKCLHRPRSSNIPYDGFRFEGTERLDREYLSSGLASLEAKVFTTDISLKYELDRLDPHKAAKRDFEDDAKAYIDTFVDDEVYQVEVDDLVGFDEGDCL